MRCADGAPPRARPGRCCRDDRDRCRPSCGWRIATRVPVVARGAGTGLSGGALPVADALLLVLAPAQPDPRGRSRSDASRASSPASPNLAISRAAAPHGLFYAPDPSSQLACSIGGNVAENSGGVHCLKYGLTFQNLLEVRLRHDRRRARHAGQRHGRRSGPAAARARVRIGRHARRHRRGHGPAAAAAGARRAAAGGIRRRRPLRRCGRSHHRSRCDPGRPRDDGCAGDPRRGGVRELRLPARCRGAAALRGRRSRRRRRSRRAPGVHGILEQAGASDGVRRARDAAERAQLWSGRKAAFPAVGRLAPDYYCMDGTIPRRHLPAVLARIDALSQRTDLPVANVFHAGDGNLHPLIMFDAGRPGEHRARRALRRRDPRALRRRRRHGHRRARRRRREAGSDVLAVRRRGARDVSCGQARLRSARPAATPARPCRRSRAARTTVRCACTGGRLPFPDLPRF